MGSRDEKGRADECASGALIQVETMQLIPGVEVTAVAAGSSKEKAEKFAEEHGETIQNLQNL